MRAVPKTEKYVPTHRAPGKHKAVRAPRRALRSGVALTGLAAAVTGTDNSYKPAMVRGATIHALTGLARRAGAATTGEVDR